MKKTMTCFLSLMVLLLFSIPTFAITKTTALTSGITGVNNAGVPDLVTVTGLVTGDIVKIYDSENSGTLMGKGVVASGKTGLTISIKQIGIASTDIFISLTSKAKSESDTFDVTVPGETISTAPDKGTITVTNNYGAFDTVKVTNLMVGDIVKVYDSEVGGNLIGKGVAVVTGKTVSTVTIPQIGVAGQVYVSLVSKNNLESDRTQLDAVPEVQTPAINSGVTATNNVGKADTVTVTGLSAGDIVSIYDSANGGNLLSKGTAVAAGKTESTITIQQIGKDDTDVFIAVAKKNQAESDRYKFTVPAENLSTAPIIGNITVTNNGDKVDTVKVTGLVEGDVVKVYDSATGGELLGTGPVVAKAKTESTAIIPQIGSGGQVYVTVTSKNCRESTRTAPDAVVEQQTTDLTGLALSGTPGNYTFAADTYVYSGVTVDHSVATIKVTPTGTGTIKVNGTTVKTTLESSEIPLVAGIEKSIVVTVAEVGKAPISYTIKVTRAIN